MIVREKSFAAVPERDRQTEAAADWQNSYINIVR